RLISSSEPYFPLIGTLGAVGLLPAVRHRLTVLAVWWAAIILLDVRAFPTFATIPVAMLAGLAVSDIVIPMLDRAHTSWERVAVVHAGNGANGNGANGASSGGARPSTQVPLPSWQVFAVLGFMLLYALVGAMIRKPGLGGEGEFLVSLSAGQRSAMHWIAEETPASSKFLVIPRTAWQVDKESEWFPVLAKRPSLATVQGT